MSEDEEFDMIDVNVSRLQVDNVVIKVPKGWKPTLWDLGEIMPQIEKMRPDTAKTWRPENNSVLPNKWRRLPEGGKPYHIDARRLIENLPPAYDPDEPWNRR
jgi:hypothetical protein